ncbi:hypothetical protein H4R33_007222, partial [Dimargaris cristalligena]
MDEITDEATFEARPFDESMIPPTDDYRGEGSAAPKKPSSGPSAKSKSASSKVRFLKVKSTTGTNITPKKVDYVATDSAARARRNNNASSSGGGSMVSLATMYNQLHKMGQNPRQGPKENELLVKCPKCPPRLGRHNYTAHLDKKSGSFTCTKCLTSGTWSQYKSLVGKNPHFHIESVSQVVVTDSDGQTKTVSGTGPFDRPLGDFQTYGHNLSQNSVVYGYLTGHEPGQRRLKPETLRKYLVGLTYLNTNPATIDSARDAIHSHRSFSRDEMTDTLEDLEANGERDVYPFIVYPRTALNDSNVKGVKRRPNAKTAAAPTSPTGATEVAESTEPTAAFEAELANPSSPDSEALELDQDQFRVTRFKAVSFPEDKHV